MTSYYNGFPQSDRDEAINMINLDELEERAKEVMPEGAYYYIASGSENEWTWRNNTAAFNHFQIVPRALTNMDSPQLDTEFMGMKLKTPVMISPIACHGIAHKDAEVATQKGAAAAGALFTSSTYANKSVEDIAAAAPNAPRFFQLYLSKDWDFNKMVFDAVKKAGYSGILLTVDALVSGFREANLRTKFAYPVPLDFFTRYQGAKGEGQTVAQMYASSAQKIGPEDIKRIKEMSGLPVFVKGVVCAEDAFLAMGAGADGIYVTNHGGREIDCGPATIDMLPEIAKAVDHRVPIIFDSGVRRGSHVFKALALGADLVGIGRPYLYGLALGGAKGVQSVIEQLNQELLIDMQLTGCKTIADIKHARLTHFNYTADNLKSNTDPSRITPYPVTNDNQLKEEDSATDAVSGASQE
ncbi:lactate oxidase [Lactobacillus panisapium]|uniref:L-lactate oxidase n=1 Tax=Lactobacillus panisapium TaxID=2012495 RepID=A0ABX8WDE0_9LACO|nr:MULTISPECIES: lactate oxidase [Lactobacillus]MCO6530874.1 alpha-hydroxy-acid oxidizing protein [Lactobacillus sp.]MCO6533450.1 alpha-hydroxy-acid oxidizing protein [Lactobacillus sp.]MCO6534485.1 alpha-hydroxy-acid oxidizing protein [Lactobacillus sp.]MCX8724750.1 alpha-hydroxy-acid oxidizing protein [Lactobacillus sp. B4007]MCX8737545.1 alpha-hydroxy-acid oxidizing protein [Lactobacillus sp. B4026]